MKKQIQKPEGRKPKAKIAPEKKSTPAAAHPHFRASGAGKTTLCDLLLAALPNLTARHHLHDASRRAQAKRTAGLSFF